MVDISKKIKELRIERRMTQSEFAERLGVTKSSISSYENGSRLPSYDVLLKMARIFKVSTDVLLGHANKNNITLDITGLTSTQVIFIKDLIENYRKANVFTSLFDTMSEEEKARIWRFVETGRQMNEE